jgi:hypothetical protein
MKFERLLIMGCLLVVFLLCLNASNHIHSIDYTVDLLNSNEGNQIFISGPVIEIFNDGFEIYETEGESFIQIETKTKANLGDYAYILGSLNSNNEFIPNKIMITKEDEIIYVILRSLFGLIIFLLIFMRYWKFNVKRVLFIKRK